MPCEEIFRPGTEPCEDIKGLALRYETGSDAALLNAEQTSEISKAAEKIKSAAFKHSVRIGKA